MTTTQRRRFTRDDRAVSVYQQVPFEVPAGAPAVTVTIEYDRTAGVIDLGALDPEVFRGWSGGSRNGYVITPTAATPGYLPGPLPAGTWNVLLGLHRVAEAGVDVTVSTSVEPAQPAPLPPAPPPPEHPPPRHLPAEGERRWLACDFHAHTVHSDGRLTIDALACLAAGRGLDVLAVTDHNTISHHPHLAAAGRHAGILLLPGQEVTTDTGHANCFGDVGWVDFREPADDWRATADARGGLLSLNHPLAGDCAWRKPLRDPPRLVEAWHSSWNRVGDAPLRWWAEHGGVPIGGSDFHRPGDHPPGAPTTWVEVEGGDVIGALAAGRVALSAHPQGPVLLRHDGELLAVDADATTLIGPAGARTRVQGASVRLPGDPGPHRLVDDAGRALAFVP